jgi:hypothetical protein
MDHVDYLRLSAIPSLHEFHIVVYRDSAEWNESVLAPPKQFLHRCARVVNPSDEIGKRINEVDCAVLPNDVTNPYCLKRGISSHFQSSSRHAQGSDGSPRLLALAISTLPPFNISVVSLYLLAALQPYCHLGVLVSAVGCTIGVFCKIDMEAFGLLGVVIIRGPKQSD